MTSPHKLAFLVVILVGGALSMPAQGEPIAEGEGLYKKDTWNIQRHYDDLDDPEDSSGIITEGRDPERPAGPATDFERVPRAGE